MSVVDPVFPGRGDNQRMEGGSKLLCGIMFAENCMEMNKMDWKVVGDVREIDKKCNRGLLLDGRIGGSKEGVPGTRPTGGPNSFIFMHFSAKKIVK